MKGAWLNGLLHGKGRLQNKETIYDGFFTKGYPTTGSTLRFKRPGEYCYYTGEFDSFEIQGHGFMTCIEDNDFKDDNEHKMAHRTKKPLPLYHHFDGEFKSGTYHG